MEQELALFPLDTVLFPGMPLTLHIFEDRYKLMVNECLQEERPFGVVLIREGVEALGPLADPYRIGCSARIMKAERLEGGRMNILVVGQERFRVLSLQEDGPYLTGMVESFPLALEGARDASRASRHLRPWIEEYLTLLGQAGDVEFDPDGLPDDPQALAFLAATILQVPNPQKQDLLSAPGAVSLLTDMRSIFRRELPVLRILLEQEELLPEEPEPFSLN